MSDLKILQVNIGNMKRQQASEFLNMLQNKVGNDIIVFPSFGEVGKITPIGAADVIHVNGSNITGEELYDAVMKLRDLKEENEDLKCQISELNYKLSEIMIECGGDM